MMTDIFRTNLGDIYTYIYDIYRIYLGHNYIQWAYIYIHISLYVFPGYMMGTDDIQVLHATDGY